jgi:hypothetical protein
MLHTPSSTENMPLFSTGLAFASSSCGMEDRLIIRPPACESLSFDWSDFPVIQQHDVNVHFPSYPLADAEVQKPTASKPLYLEYESSATDLYSCTSDSDLSSASSTKSSSKRVSFSSSLQIRTHSIVLGDHPFCRSLALELGWEYDDTELVNMEIHEQHKPGYNTCRRRSYIERKNLLRRVSGMTESEIRDQSNHMRHSAPSSRQLSEMAGVQL